RRASDRENDAAVFDELLQLGHGSPSSDGPDVIAIFERNRSWSLRGLLERIVSEDQHIEFLRQVSGIQNRRIDHAVWKLELFENQPGPPGRDRAAVAVPYAD